MGYMQSQLRLQEEVVAYKGLVRIGVNRPPWRYILTGTGIAIAPKLIQVAVLRKRLPTIIDEPQELRSLLSPGAAVSLQLEHDAFELSLMMVTARLARLDVTEERVEFCFVFDQVDSEIMSLCAEIQRLQRG